MCFWDRDLRGMKITYSTNWAWHESGFCGSFFVPFCTISTCLPSMESSSFRTREWGFLAHHSLFQFPESLLLLLEAIGFLVLYFDFYSCGEHCPQFYPPPPKKGLALSWTQLHALLTHLVTFGSSGLWAVRAVCDISSMWLEWLYCMRWISFFHCLPQEKSRC